MLPNYHEKSIKMENEYARELLVLFGFLLLDINKNKELTKANILATVVAWRKQYGDEIKQITNDHITKINAYASKIMQNNLSPTQSKELISKLTSNSNNLLGITTDYIQTEFIELGMLEKQTTSTFILDRQLQTITNQVEKKIVTHAEQSTKFDFKTIIFNNAYSQGWEEYCWETQRDSKVRPSHAAMDGKWVEITDQNPSPAGCPVGEDYNCRCYALNFRSYLGGGKYRYMHMPKKDSERTNAEEIMFNNTPSPLKINAMTKVGGKWVYPS